MTTTAHDSEIVLFRVQLRRGVMPKIKNYHCPGCGTKSVFPLLKAGTDEVWCGCHPGAGPLNYRRTPITNTPVDPPETPAPEDA